MAPPRSSNEAEFHLNVNDRDHFPSLGENRPRCRADSGYNGKKKYGNNVQSKSHKSAVAVTQRERTQAADDTHPPDSHKRPSLHDSQSSNEIRSSEGEDNSDDAEWVEDFALDTLPLSPQPGDEYRFEEDVVVQRRRREGRMIFERRL